jgi:ATP-dependent protease ClpP protease subunit
MEFQLPINNNPDKQKKLNQLEITKKIFGSPKKYRHWTVNLDSYIEDPKDYRELVSVLRKAKEGDVVEFVITSWGGYIDSAIMLVNELVLTKARTIAVIHTAGSAATLIAFACDELVASPISTIMIHNFSVTQQGKGQEVRAKAEFDEKQFSLMSDLLYTGILSNSEIKAVQEDKDIWLLGCELKNRMVDLDWEPLRSPDKLRSWYACE